MKRSLLRFALILAAASAWADPSGLELKNLDRSVRPSQDFFQYANGGWLKANPIPADKPRWGTFNQLMENNQAKLDAILKECASHPRDVNGRKLGDFYRSGLERDSQAEGLRRLRLEWDDLQKVDSLPQLQAWVARQHARGNHPYFNFGSAQDYRDSSKVIGQLSQGGLGLDRDYYFRGDDKSVEIRQRYVEFIQACFQKWGLPPALAASKADAVMALETRMARHSMSLVEQRDPAATYHPVELAQLSQMAGEWDWPTYFETLQAPAMSQLNLAMPAYFEGLAGLLREIPLKNHRAYLEWQLLRNSADYLDEDWAQLHFGFYGKVLTGAQTIAPRWRRVVKVIDTQMGDALGEKYVARHFPPAAKAKVEDMVARLRKALSTTLANLDWMSAATKEAAQQKLASFHAKIGYPERWRDYSGLNIDSRCYLANVWSAQAYEVQRDLKKIGQPQDHNEWYMSPPTVNAYYDPQNNEIVFPAGIMQPPFFSLQADDAVNYGAIGTVIGHEITHGFDDQGAQFDSQGNLRNWWSEEDLKRFQELAQAIIDQFGQYQVADGLHINGKLVVGESIADLGGLKLALAAYHDFQQDKPEKTLDGFTPDQRFFLGYARIWAMNLRPEYERLQVNTDPHPHPRYRVNGPLSNLKEFQNAFSCPDGTPMVRAKRNRVW